MGAVKLILGPLEEQQVLLTADLSLQLLLWYFYSLHAINFLSKLRMDCVFVCVYVIQICVFADFKMLMVRFDISLISHICLW